MKWLKRILYIGALVILVVLLVVLLLKNTLVKMGVERGGEYATGQTTTLQSADLSIFGGSLGLNGLDIANPKGYSTPSLLKLGKTAVTVKTGSLLSNEVVVNEILIDGMEVTLEQQGLKNNLGEVLDVIKAKTAAAGGADAASKESPGKSLKIGLIKMTNTKVTVKAGVGMTINIPEISMVEPTNPDGRSMKIADVIGKVLIATAQAIAENPQLPGDFKGGLNSAMKGINDVTKQLQGGVKGIEDATKGIKDAGKGLENLFKKPEEKK